MYIINIKGKLKGNFCEYENKVYSKKEILEEIKQFSYIISINVIKGY